MDPPLVDLPSGFLLYRYSVPAFSQCPGLGATSIRETGQSHRDSSLGCVVLQGLSSSAPCSHKDPSLYKLGDPAKSVNHEYGGMKARFSSSRRRRLEGCEAFRLCKSHRRWLVVEHECSSRGLEGMDSNLDDLQMRLMPRADSQQTRRQPISEH